MPIRPTTLQRDGRKSLVVMGGDQTLGDALARLGELGYHENDAYLVVDRGDGQYQVALFLDLHLVVSRLGHDSFAIPLQALPIPFADRVVPTDTPESGGEIVRWANRTPQSAVVVVEAGQVVGLFASRSRSARDAVFQPAPLLELHGQLAQLYDDPRAAFEARVAAPACPHCAARGFYRYDPRQRVYTCRSCGHVVDLQ